MACVWSMLPTPTQTRCTVPHHTEPYCARARTNRPTDRPDGRTDERTNGRTNERTNERMDEWMNSCTKIHARRPPDVLFNTSANCLRRRSGERTVPGHLRAALLSSGAVEDDITDAADDRDVNKDTCSMMWLCSLPPSSSPTSSSPFGGRPCWCKDNASSTRYLRARTFAHRTTTGGSGAIHSSTAIVATRTNLVEKLISTNEGVDDARVAGWLAGWLDGWMDGWMDGRSR